jgi:DNA-binding MarR family transcriptional regulator
MVYDPIRTIREQWQCCRPDLDTGPMETAGRLLLAASLLQNRLEPEFHRYGISSGGFDILATLRRQGDQFELTPTMLYKELLITSGTITYRLDTLEAKGLIKRLPHPSDRRGLIIRLTAKGLKLIDRVIADHMENEKRLFQSLSQEKAERLSRILNEWIESLDSA